MQLRQILYILISSQVILFQAEDISTQRGLTTWMPTWKGKNKSYGSTT